MLESIKKIAEACPCGAKHTMSTSVIKTENGSTEKLYEYVKANYCAEAALVVSDENTHKYACPIVNTLGCREYVNPGNAHANEIETAKLTNYINSLDKKPSVMIACGSGSVHDITRYCAYDAGIEFISYPTAASVDGFVSGVAAMTMYGQKLTYTSASPVAIFAEPDVYCDAPARLTASGVGDIIGKITALFDWKVANLLTGETLCPEIYSLMKNALDIIIDAVKSGDTASHEFTEKIMNGLILSGLSMQLQGNSRPASGAEHHMSHFWEMHVMNEPTDALHGEKVGVGTIYVLENYAKCRDIDFSRCFDYEKIFDREIIGDVYGELTDGTMKENLPDGTYKSSAIAKIGAGKIEEHIETIRKMIDELPTAGDVRGYLSACGAPTTLSSVGLPESPEFAERSLLFSPYVRNRLTLGKVISALKLSK